MSEKERIEKAVAIADEYSSIDGGHHKNWVIDQMVRALLPADEVERKGYNDPNWQDECIAP